MQYVNQTLHSSIKVKRKLFKLTVLKYANGYTIWKDVSCDINNTESGEK